MSGALDPALAVLALIGLGAMLAAIGTLLSAGERVNALVARCVAIRERLAREPEAPEIDEIDAVQELATEAVETTTSGVREVHRAISDIPFDVLDALPPTRAAAQLARQAHNGVTDGVYDAISEANRVAGGVFRLLRRPHTPRGKP